VTEIRDQKSEVGNLQRKVINKTFVRVALGTVLFAISFLGVLLLALWSIAEAQPAKKIRVIGFLGGSSPSSSLAKSNIDAFRQGLRDLGYIEGTNIVVESRYAEGREDRHSEFVAEFVRFNVDVIVTGSTIAVRAARQLTGTIPIVMAGTGDPVGTGLIASLARPGGNVTGLAALGPELTTKQLEVLKETFPQASRVLFLFNGANASTVAALKATEIAATALGVKLQASDVRGANDIEPAFNAAARNRANALLVLREALYQAYRSRIVSLAIQRKLPAIYPIRQYVDVGGLMSYGISTPDLFRRVAVYVDKILKGANPAYLPVEQPRKFELVINMNTAKQIGVTIPQSVLYRADKVIR
jgi:putative ABC transport system substrate-binding protein